MSETNLLQLQFGKACMRPSRSFVIVHLWMDFKIIWHSYSPGGVEVPFEIFVQVG